MSELKNEDQEIMTWWRIYNCRAGEYGEPFPATEKEAHKIMKGASKLFVLEEMK